MKATLRTNEEIVYEVIDSTTETIVQTTHIVSIPLAGGLTQELQVKTVKGQDEKQVITDHIERYLRQISPKLDQQIKEIEEKEFIAEQGKITRQEVARNTVGQGQVLVRAITNEIVTEYTEGMEVDFVAGDMILNDVEEAHKYIDSIQK